MADTKHIKFMGFEYSRVGMLSKLTVFGFIVYGRVGRKICFPFKKNDEGIGGA